MKIKTHKTRITAATIMYQEDRLRQDQISKQMTNTLIKSYKYLVIKILNIFVQNNRKKPFKINTMNLCKIYL